MDLIEFLKDKKCPVTKSIIAERLYDGKKTPATIFHNKLHNVQGRKFSMKEKQDILTILAKISAEFSSLTI